MNPMKRLGLVAVFLVGVTLLASTPAAAEGKVKGEDWGTVELENVGDEPQASGQASLNNVELVLAWVGLHVYKGELTVTCQGLTPRATYWTPAGTFKADRTGAGQVKGRVEFEFHWVYWGWDEPVFGDSPPWIGGEPYWDGPYPWGFMVDVARLNPDGSEAVVLSGGIPYADESYGNN